MNTQTLHGHNVVYDDNNDKIHGAYSYLANHISKQESQVFFHEAKSNNYAAFVSHEGHHFKLKHSGDSYYIERNSDY